MAKYSKNFNGWQLLAENSKGQQNYWPKIERVEFNIRQKIEKPNDTKGGSFTETCTNHEQKKTTGKFIKWIVCFSPVY